MTARTQAPRTGGRPGAAADGSAADGPGADRRPGGSPDHARAVAALDELRATLDRASEWLGDPLAAYVSGAASHTQLAGWVEAGPAAAAGRDALARLRTAGEVVDIFAAAGQPGEARAWLREVSPRTLGRSPAQLLRHARHERLLSRIRHAAHDAAARPED
ncbi:MAG TPA: hypothetical protein VFY17_09035 [Pilimelia sp.]|nr:hypothetical protein [Pilimelia sp.]